MSSKLSIRVDAHASGARVDSVISLYFPKLSRSVAAKLITDGNVTVNGIVPSKSYRCKESDFLSIFVPDARPLKTEAQNIPLDIVYEDGDLLVVNKPKGMVVHPAPGNYHGTLVNALLYYCKDNLSGINGVVRPGIVHRIDKDTSGLLVVAKNDLTHVGLAEQIKEHSFHRAYCAVAYGNIEEDSGTVNQPIGRNPNDRKKMAVTLKNSKDAITHYEVKERYGDFTQIRCVLETGRTHQIRAHMAYIGHPLAGDSVYGPKKVITSLNGQCLHAGEIGFVHPRTKKYLEFEAELPDYFKDFISSLNGGEK
ncbi:MAG: RluA family pseudouridine synthase [Clostridiales bacterium]|nr:RluA family pseudouridine synthase [Clostridiales bacterium]